MKKSVILITTMAMSIATVATLMTLNFSDAFVMKATERPSSMSCDYYFNPANGFTPIYDIVQDAQNKTEPSKLYKTWGTVTCQFETTNNQTTSTYIQSRDANGNNSAILLYGLNTGASLYPVGSVVELSFYQSNLTLYNNLPQIQTSLESIELVYNSNPSEVEPYRITTDNFSGTTDKYSKEFLRYYSYGPRKVSLRNIALSSNPGNAYVNARLNPDSSNPISIKLYYGGSNLPFTSPVKTALTNAYNNNQRLNIVGYCNAYSYGTNSYVQVYLRSADDIEAFTPGDKYLTGIYVYYSQNAYDVGEQFVRPTVTANYSDGSSNDVTDYAVCTGYNMLSSSVQIVRVTYSEDDYSYYYDYIIYVFGESGTTTLVLDQSASSLISSRSTGEYGGFTYKNTSFEYYRTNGNQNDSLAKLLYASNDYLDTIGGSIYNYSPLYCTKEVTINYSTDYDYGDDKPTFYYGEHGYEHSEDFDFSSSNTFVTFDELSDVNYIKVETGDCNMTIYSICITLAYTATSTGYSFNISGMGLDQYRAAPSAYADTLTDGSTSVTVPVDGYVSGDEFIATETRTYTYYSYDYVEENPSFASVAAMTDPVDVANYYSIFKKFPANYVSKTNYPAAEYIFGSDTRCVSTYSRTDGYANAIPWAEYGSTSAPRYHELDIDLTGDYSSNNRGAGRIIAFESGLNAEDYGYGSQVACYFSDDHYATFQEFNNLGGFLPRFNAERRVTNLAWGRPTTVTVA